MSESNYREQSKKWGQESNSSKYGTKSSVRSWTRQHGCDARNQYRQASKSVLYRSGCSPEKARKYNASFFCHVAFSTYIQFDSDSRIRNCFVSQSHPNRSDFEHWALESNWQNSMSTPVPDFPPTPGRRKCFENMA